jgi:hypothetical protein
MVHIFRSLKITYRNALNDTRVIDATIDSSLHQVFLGTLLGDGYMKEVKCYGLGHGVYQMDYLYHVAERMHSFIASLGDKNTQGTTKKSFEFWTYRHDVLEPYYQRFYSKGRHKKFFITESAPDLGPEGLAYWYMDDGSYGKHGFGLCVGNMSKPEGDILRGMLLRNFGLISTWQLHETERNYHTIYITAESRSNFIGLIIPFIIPSMRYKLDGSIFPRPNFSQDSVVKRHLELCQKAGRMIRYFGESNIQEEINKTAIIDFKSEYITQINEAIKTNTQISKTSFRKLPSEEEVLILFNQSLTDDQIAERFGVGRNRISKIRRSLKIDKKSRRITEEQNRRLLELFSDSTMTIQKAMKEIGLSFYKIKHWRSQDVQEKVS